MRTAENWHPAVLFAWFAAAAVPMMTGNGLLLPLIGGIGAVLLLIAQEKCSWKRCLLALTVALSFALINPLLSHRGETVLFFLNGQRITREALICGLSSGLAAGGVLLLCMSFSDLMTSDRLLALFGVFTPKAALVLSMSLRYVPLFLHQRRRITDAQKGIGMLREDSFPEAVRGRGRIFSVMVTWALENGIITAESMEARGYGMKRYRRTSRFHFGRWDAVILALCAVLTIPALLLLREKNVFYPNFSSPPLTPARAAGYLCYALLCLTPTLLEIEDRIKWHTLQSKI